MSDVRERLIVVGAVWPNPSEAQVFNFIKGIFIGNKEELAVPKDILNGEYFQFGPGDDEQKQYVAPTRYLTRKGRPTVLFDASSQRISMEAFERNQRHQRNISGGSNTVTTAGHERYSVSLLDETEGLKLPTLLLAGERRHESGTSTRSGYIDRTTDVRGELVQNAATKIGVNEEHFLLTPAERSTMLSIALHQLVDYVG